MAGQNDATVNVADDTVVTVELGDEALAAAADELAGAEGAEPVVEPKKPAEPRQRSMRPSAAEEAAAALTQSLKTAEDARKAAEATALAERQRAEAATRLAQQRETEAKELRERTEDQELTIITSGLDAAKRDLDAATAEAERAMEAGDFKATAAAQAKLARAGAAVDRYEARKAEYEAGVRKPATTATTEGRVVEAPAGSAFERYVAGFAPRAQTWLRAHPECVPAEVGGSATKNAAMMQGHFAALKDGVQEGSEDYFRIIEEHTGYRAPVSAAANLTPAETEPRTTPKPPAAAPRRPAPAAPPTRDGTEVGTAPTTRSIKLNPQQQEVALYSYPANPGESEQAHRARAFGIYARELIAAQAEGKIGRLTH